MYKLLAIRQKTGQDAAIETMKGTKKMIEQVETRKAPSPIGPYSQGIRTDSGFLFLSGQIPIDPESGAMLNEGIEVQTRRVLDNLTAVLDEAGHSWKNVCKVTILLKDLEDFGVVNSLYAEYVSNPYPARATFQVARLPADAKIEVDLVSYSA